MATNQPSRLASALPESAQRRSVIMLGATGAVGGQVVARLLGPLKNQVERLTLLGRRPVPNIAGPGLAQHAVDVFAPSSYQHLLAGHDCAVCTFGAGESSKLSKAELVKIDKDAVVAFAAACKGAGVRHFELLCAVGANAKSPSFYLALKGELQDALIALKFERLSLFQPSMILTPTNRYGVLQGLTLALWPVLTPVLAGPLHKYRGIAVETLGQAMANNLFTTGSGTAYLTWDDFKRLAGCHAPCASKLFF